jgi:hypothetical protein
MAHYAPAGSGVALFRDLTTCTNERRGCTEIKADNPNTPGDDIFYYTLQNCDNSGRSLSILTSYFGRSLEGECGDSAHATRLFPALEGTGVSDADVLNLVEQGTPVIGPNGEEWLRYVLTPEVFGAVLVAENGDRYPLVAEGGALEITMDPSDFHVVADLANPKAYPVVEAWLTAVDRLRADHGLGAALDFEAEIFGVRVDGLPNNRAVALSPTFDTDYVRTRLLDGFAGETVSRETDVRRSARR